MKKQGVLDFGNTKMKLALFEDGKSVSVDHFNYSDPEEIKSKLEGIINTSFIYSSVLSESDLKKLLPNKACFHDIRNLDLPIRNLYETPETLGEDRIANAAALQFYASKKNALCIDLGTCLKFDFKNHKDEYLGGSISPGIRMRFEALHQFTGKLPMIDEIELEDLIGKNTEKSMISGVLNGIQEEIKGFINRYSERYPDLTIFMTGGDSDKLQLDIKNPIFADSTFTLKGLQIILDYNEL